MTDEIIKPSEQLLALMKLSGNGRFDAVKIDVEMTGCDTSETYLCLGIFRSFHDRRITWHHFDMSVRHYLDFNPDHSSVCQVKRDYADTVQAWNEFLKRNARELATYQRLKKKFEGTASA